MPNIQITEDQLALIQEALDYFACYLDESGQYELASEADILINELND